MPLVINSDKKPVAQVKNDTLLFYETISHMCYIILL